MGDGTELGRGRKSGGGEGREEGESGRGPLGFYFYHYRNEVTEGATQPIRSESLRESRRGILGFYCLLKR